LFGSNVSDGSKREDSHEKTSYRIDEAHSQRILQEVVMESIITGERYHRSECNPDGVEVLSHGIDPHLEVDVYFKVRQDKYT